VLVEDNEILNMGLSGIGSAWFIQPTAFRAVVFAVRTKRSLSNPVESLTIRQNHIFNCLQNPYNIYEAEVQKIGLGGISLGMCDNLSIFGNRIENNGLNHIYPVCGIYIYHGEFVDISHNIIVNNGPLMDDTTADPEKGIRGGIFIHYTTLITASRESLVSIGKPDARVHDNVVDQPAGRALTITGRGCLSILNNQFNSELSDSEDVKFKVGTVKIINKGEHYLGRPAASTEDPADTGYSLLGVPYIYIGTSRRIERPKGNILFNNNQTRMGPENNSHISQVIISNDDIGFDGNQSDDLGKGNLEIAISGPLGGASSIILAINTILKAPTLRATDNRFKERNGSQTDSSKIISLLTYGNSMNYTTNNQGDHCIFAYIANGGQITDSNQVWYEANCDASKPLFKEENSIITQLITELLFGG
jgi:hypothetical protein